MSETYPNDDPTLGGMWGGDFNYHSEARLNLKDIHQYRADQIPDLPTRAGMMVVVIGDEEFDVYKPNRVIIRSGDNSRWVTVGVLPHLHDSDAEEAGGYLSRIMMANQPKLLNIYHPSPRSEQFHKTFGGLGTITNLEDTMRLNTGSTADGFVQLKIPCAQFTWEYEIKAAIRLRVASGTKFALKYGVNMEAVGEAGGLTKRLGIEICDVDGTERDLKMVTSDGSLASYQDIVGEPVNSAVDRGYRMEYMPNNYVRFFKYDENGLSMFIEKKNNVPLASGSTTAGRAFSIGYQTKEATDKQFYLNMLHVIGHLPTNYV